LFFIHLDSRADRLPLRLLHYCYTLFAAYRLNGHHNNRPSRPQ